MTPYSHVRFHSLPSLGPDVAAGRISERIRNLKMQAVRIKHHYLFIRQHVSNLSSSNFQKLNIRFSPKLFLDKTMINWYDV